MKRGKRADSGFSIVGIIFIVLVLIVVVGVAGAFIWYKTNTKPVQENEEKVTVVIESGSGVIKIAEQLENEKVIRNADACLFGAAGESAADVIVKLRQSLKLFANLRPVKSYPGTKALFDNLDIMIVRENTEGLYKADTEEETEEGAIAKRIITRERKYRITTK